MSSTIVTSLKRSRSSTPSLGTRPSTPSAGTEKDTSELPDLVTGEPQIKQELDHWQNIVFSFGMDDNSGREDDPNYPGDYPGLPHPHLHHLPRGRSHGQAQNDVPPFPSPSPWDIPPFFPGSTYGQQSPYDMLALGGISPMPGLAAPHPHPSSNPHASLDPFNHHSWDMNFYPELQRPQSQPQLPPLSPAEIAQYHALIARGAGGFPLPPQPPTSPSVQTTGMASSAPIASGMVQAAPSLRDRSGSSAGRSSSQGQTPSAPTSPVDDESNVVIAEDKRRRNTAASARFRVKKKQRTAELERTLTELEGRAGELEKEAVELRRENGWLKEMVILKGRKAMETANVSASSSAVASPGSAAGRDKLEHDNQSNEGEGSDERGEGKSKE